MPKVAAGQSRQPPSRDSITGPCPPELDSDDDRSDDDDDDDRPGDQIQSTQPILEKRKRLIPVSCEICKQRKVKCDRNQPSCGWCARNGARCEYKERKRPGLRAGFGKELQERMDRIEAILRSHADILHASVMPGLRSGSSTDLDGVKQLLASNQSLPVARGGWHHYMIGTADLSAASSTANPPQMPKSPNAGPDLRHHQVASLCCPSTVPVLHHVDILPAVRGPGDSALLPPPLAPHSSHCHSLPPANAVAPTSTDDEPYGSTHAPGPPPSPTTAVARPRGALESGSEMPPYDLLYSLVELYFEHINTWCPILHRKMTFDTLFAPSLMEPTDRILLHAIIAVSMRYSTDARLTEEKRQHYYRISKETVLLSCMENSSVKLLQALVILAVDLCGRRHGPPGWNIMALVTRSVVQLGLAVESNSFSVAPGYESIYTLRATILPEPQDFVEDESRRRLFWMIYVLDRYATIVTAFDFALVDGNIDRRLPCRDDLWVKNQEVETSWFRKGLSGSGHEGGTGRWKNVGAFAHQVEILGLLSKIHDFLKEPVDIGAAGDVERWKYRYWELDEMLASWRMSLPGEFGSTTNLDFQRRAGKGIACGWVMLHATYYTAEIRLHSPAAYPATRSAIFAPSYSASQRCQEAVKRIVELVEMVIDSGLLTALGPPFAFALWVAARLLLVNGSTVERQLSPQIDFLVEALRSMGRYWPVAARYSELLQRVLDEHAESERQGGGVTPKSVRILSDMRRTASDLDFLMSRQPRHGAVGGPVAATTTTTGSTRTMSVMAGRTPAPNEMDYLDVFNFFNLPRLAYGGGEHGSAGGAAVGDEGAMGVGTAENSGTSVGAAAIAATTTVTTTAATAATTALTMATTGARTGEGSRAAGGALAHGNVQRGRMGEEEEEGQVRGPSTGPGPPSQYHMASFIIGPNSDWPFKQDESSKFRAIE